MPENLCKHSEFIVSCYERVTRLETPGELFSLLKETATALGFTNYAVVFLPDRQDRQIRSAFVATNVSSDLVAEYDRHRLLENSPVMSALRTDRKPVEYDVEHLPLQRSEEQTAVIRELFIRHKVPRGVFLPCYDHVGRKGAIAFMGERPLPTSGETAMLHLLCHYAFGHLHLLLSASQRTKELTPREIECVELAALGKTNLECGLILGVSETTIAGYFSSVSRKLNAANKTHIVALAYERGLIAPKGKEAKARLKAHLPEGNLT
ncbi:autoinducer binding domain-containing protein [Roseibium sp.]|uniref:helix-turn-helix transcriptional regulator n=1 Tax=Roseibium sp. TaxID=1936156 RepID=UPI003BAD875E